jgi:hypothetical protein
MTMMSGVNTVPISSAALIGGLASLSIVFLWLVTFHKRFFLSLMKTQQVNVYGVYTDFGEALRTHFWFLIKGKFVKLDRAKLEVEVKAKFLEQLLGDSEEDASKSKQVLVTHSCRSLFYYVIRILLEESKERTGEMRIKVALPSVHFGSFYRLLKGMEKSMNCKVDFYEIDLHEDDWTLDEDSVDEAEFKTCDLVLCQHLFGYPFQQDKLFQLGKKHNIPILEDCVQSGSLFGKYKGNPLSDVIMYSGGLDKTPQCFGAGMGYFRDTRFGNNLYAKGSAFHETLPHDTWKARLIACFNQLIHLTIAKNRFGFNNLLGLIAYVWLSERGDFINWTAVALKIRKSKAITPFQHAESGFLRKPTPYQLQSILYGMSKTSDYRRIAKNEVESRDLLLSNIPTKYHNILFPWYTPKVLQCHRDNLGISEFTWVVPPKGISRIDLCQFLNDHFIVVLINTTWDFHEFTKRPVGKEINNGLVYLPNINQMTDAQIIYTAQTLTKYCDSCMNDTPIKAKKNA